jgi:hypothetical protein
MVGQTLASLDGRMPGHRRNETEGFLLRGRRQAVVGEAACADEYDDADDDCKE